MLNMAQIEKLDKLQAILSTQVAIEKTTRNEIIMNKYIKYSFVAVVILVVGVYYGMNNYNTQPAVEKATEVYTCSMHPEIIRDEPGNCPICGMNLVKKVTEGQSVESHSIDHLYDQLISLWWGLSNYNSKGYGYQ
jgi:hypothetical protein